MVKIELPADKAEALLEGLLDLTRYYEFLRPGGREKTQQAAAEVAEDLAAAISENK